MSEGPQEELEASIHRLVQSRLEHLGRDQVVAAQAALDQVAAEITAELRARGVPVPAPVRITVTGPGRYEVGYEGKEVNKEWP